ncbi:MAG: hypothetical protein GEU28_01025 [Dehalococcoidia bacterium]|nr:hypothetical protein [Dehalococcoidia bacterium]
MQSFTWKWVLVLALGAALLVGAACGDDDDDDDDDSGDATAEEDAGDPEPEAETEEPTDEATEEAPIDEPEATEPGNVTIIDLSFDPVQFEVPVGTSVTWTNDDTAPHTVTSDDGSTFASETVESGQAFEFTFDAAGEFAYHCEIHPGMQATVTVAE